jgi:Uma2 family endonuclease
MVATKLDTALDFERFVRDHPGKTWELHRGQAREKPPMVLGHELAQYGLFYQLVAQLNPDEYEVRAGAGRVASSTSFYVPDLFILPRAHLAALAGQEQSFHSYREPLPLVVEIWSPSTGTYDIDKKLPEYTARGDQEIWRLHPFERTLKTWRRRPDGDYDVVELTGDVVELHALPGVVIDLDKLFALA